MANKTIKKILWSLPALSASALIFWASSCEHPYTPDLGLDFGDKILHASSFFLYGISLSAMIQALFPIATKRKLATVILLTGSLYGASDEFHQLFVPGRSCEFGDWLADTAGVALSLIAYNLVRRIVNGRSFH